MLFHFYGAALCLPQRSLQGPYCLMICGTEAFEWTTSCQPGTNGSQLSKKLRICSPRTIQIEDQCFPTLIWVSTMSAVQYKFFLISSADEIISMKSTVTEVKSNTMPCIQPLRNVLCPNLCFSERFIRAYAARNSTIMTKNIKCWVILHNKVELWAYLTR